MPGETIDIERIVREVLAAWQNGRARTPEPIAETKATNAEKHNPEQLSLTDRVITLATLEGKLGTIKRVAVSRGSVVTPAVRDELKRRGIELTTGETKGRASASPSFPSLILAGASEQTNQIEQALRSSHQIEIVTATAEIGTTLKALADRLLTIKRPGVLLTKQSAAALVLANRNHSLRAIGGMSVEQVTRDANAIGANLLIASPVEMGRCQIAQIIKAFVNPGWRQPPNDLAKLLAGT